MEHASTPWFVRHGTIVYNEYGDIAECVHPLAAERHANAIILAVNTHAELLAALKKLVAAVDGNGLPGSLGAANENARAVITKAGG